MNEYIKVTAQYEPCMDTIDVWIKDIKDPLMSGTIAKAMPLIFQEIKEGELFEPAFRLKINAAQELMNDLWNAGIRPRNMEITKETIKAIDNHLQDMRAIVFDRLKLEKT